MAPDTRINGKGLKLCCLNINRLLGKLDQVKMCLSYQNLDIFGLYETFLDNQVENRIICHYDYLLERRDRVDKMGGGPVCYIHDAVSYKRTTHLED